MVSQRIRADLIAGDVKQTTEASAMALTDSLSTCDMGVLVRATEGLYPAVAYYALGQNFCAQITPILGSDLKDWLSLCLKFLCFEFPLL